MSDLCYSPSASDSHPLADSLFYLYLREEQKKKKKKKETGKKTRQQKTEERESSIALE
jgi:hypothetical protein